MCEQFCTCQAVQELLPGFSKFLGEALQRCWKQWLVQPLLLLLMLQRWPYTSLLSPAPTALLALASWRRRIFKPMPCLFCAFRSPRLLVKVWAGQRQEGVWHDVKYWCHTLLMNTCRFSFITVFVLSLVTIKLVSVEIKNKNAVFVSVRAYISQWYAGRDWATAIMKM